MSALDTVPAVGALPVSRAFRERLLERLPGLAEPAHAALFAHTLFGTYVASNHDGGGTAYERVAVSARVLAEIEGQERALRWRKYRALPLLEAHRRVLPGFAWTGYTRGHYPRQVDHDGLPEDLADHFLDELTTPVADIGPAVDLATGAPVPAPTNGSGARARIERTARARKVAAARAAVASPGEGVGGLCEEQAFLLRVLNQTPSHALARLVRDNAPSAAAACRGVTPSGPVVTRLRYPLREAMALRRVQYLPAPPYGPSWRGRTVRVFPTVHPSVVALRRDVRKASLAGAVDVDLTNAQLAVVSVLWKAGPVRTLLERGGSAWPYLLGVVRDHHGLADAEAKGALKEAVYAVVFGMGVQGVRLGLGRSLSFGAAAAFLADPVVESLFERREGALSQIEEQGGARDCFGVWYPVREGRERKDEVRSALAASVQAEELRLMLPVAEAADHASRTSRPEFRVVAWQHDGCTVRVRYGTEGIVQRLQRAVNRGARRLGYPTTLEAEVL